MKTVGVFFGGRSNEHEISVITGMYAVNLLRGAGYRVLPVYLPQSGGMACAERARGVKDFCGETKFPPVYLRGRGLYSERRPGKRIAALDCALNCCHGGMGEGGVLSALFEWNGLPSASPGMAGSAVFLDKILSKIVLRGLKIPTARSFAVTERAFPSGSWREEAARLGYPVIVKPSKLGSSIGVAVAKGEEELQRALAAAFRLDGAALVEEYLAGKRDLNCAVYRLGGRLIFSPVEEVFSAGEVLSFREKYEEATPEASRIPAEIPGEAEEHIREYLGCAYEQLSLCGVVRGDFLLAEGKIYFNELNTVPGTLATRLFGEKLTCARDLLVSLIEDALAKRPTEKETVASGILRSGVFGARKLGKSGDFRPKTP